MSSKHTPRADEGLMMMQELEDRLREHTDKLEHIRLSTVELRDTLSGKEEDDVQECVCEHVQWLAQLSDRLENLQMNTAVFVQMNAKPRSFRGKPLGLRGSAHWGRSHVTGDVQSEHGWSPVRTRRNSDAASEMSCAW
ncbi:hypothetical protein F2P79_007624 [Pimephales promelas]|nr:hypothetical protein F2P79_007624 [Pimephales promelas]KAG1957676.1 hypothetical protein F2P79_007624 [Pimephales promelas]